MDDFIKAMENIVEQSKNNFYNNTNTKFRPVRWKECVELLKDGWQQTNSYIPDPDKASVILTWELNGEVKKVKLSLIEQQLWIKYLEDKITNKGRKKEL